MAEMRVSGLRFEVKLETNELRSEHLSRTVKIDFYHQEDVDLSAPAALLLVNDGQDLAAMDFNNMLRTFIEKHVNAKSLLVAGIHSGDDRNNEYGMSGSPDFRGWGSKASDYENFVIHELLPFVRSKFVEWKFNEYNFAGFSLGGLSAFDISWNHPEIFSHVAVFSGSFWWRSVEKHDRSYDPWKHRMMHLCVSKSELREGMRFFFECGELDEEEDRNRNGVIDSIDDTIDLMRLLVQKGYREGKDFIYLQMPEGRHDVATWAKAFPVFLEWRVKIKDENLKLKN